MFSYRYCSCIHLSANYQQIRIHLVIFCLSAVYRIFTFPYTIQKQITGKLNVSMANLLFGGPSALLRRMACCAYPNIR